MLMMVPKISGKRVRWGCFAGIQVGAVQGRQMVMSVPDEKLFRYLLTTPDV